MYRANATNKERVIKKVEKEHNRVTDLIATRIASEVDVVEAPRYRRSFSPCLQEYVEASLMLHFMKTGQLLSREELESTIKLSCEKAEVPPLKLEVSDYILGAGDIAGELNRIVISVSAGGDLKYALEIRDFLRRFKIVLDAVPFHKRDHRIAKDLNTKKNTLQSSIAKIEKACFDLVVRRAEFPTSTPKSKKRPNADVIDEAAERSKRTRVNESN